MKTSVNLYIQLYHICVPVCEETAWSGRFYCFCRSESNLLQSVKLILRCRHSLVRLITGQNTVKLLCFCQNVSEIQPLDGSFENNSASITIEEGLKG